MTVQRVTTIPDQCWNIERRKKGFLATFRSKKNVSNMPSRPATMGTRTAELRQLYLLPPQLIPTRNKVELTTIDADPIQSKERSFSRIGVTSSSYRKNRGTITRPTAQNGRLM